MLYPDVPEFVPATNLPENHHYVGICQWTPSAARPEWWDRMRADPKPKVFVSLGSSGPMRALPALLQALAKLPVAVLISTSSRAMPTIGPGAYVACLLPFTETAAEELLYAGDLVGCPTSWSPDGKFILYDGNGDTTNVNSRSSIQVLPLPPPGGQTKPFRLVANGVNETDGRFSPDGRWVTYRSFESQPGEIYVTRFVGGESRSTGRWQISTGGGIMPRWRADGREIFFIAPGGRLMAAEIRLKEAAVEVGPVRALGNPLPGMVLYDVAADGQKFLVALTPEPSVESLTLVQNWVMGLAR